ncbi:SDR family NAD(P)-dependent oxidoreductase [Fulvivirga sp. 29W222]|uniref:SDR family NAD(P)-dependent oxidoreductase n=1 Tax=Fulvivirga marina TaxID=2494733 RepID=A0A937G0R2_9BACT|nr:SDR family NAD(P)-dependent oxidoreductase [Fulvivirga marina]MBL6449564.1 SDR family NAD(P)-dependent oxidoreductase [Fulvivirga marina]
MELLKIYQDLSSGKLTQKEALEKIKAIKQQKQGKGTGRLLARPSWEQASVSRQSEGQPEYTQHHLVLCELPHLKDEQLKKALPHLQVLALPAAKHKNIAERFNSYALSCFELVRKILSNKPAGPVLIQLVVANHGEQAIFAGLLGLLKTASLENPQLVHQVIITEPEVNGEELVSQLQANQAEKQNTLIKYEHGTRYVMQLKEIKAGQVQPKIAFKDQGAYLITGGLGGLGVVFTKELLRQTSRARIILTGRSKLTAEKKAILDALPVGNHTVEYMQMDMDDAAQVKNTIASIIKEHKQLNGIIHSAGVAFDNFILRKSNEEFEKVLAPKVSGTFNLDEATKDIDLDFLVLFSSITSMMGNVGQSDYAVANGFMDHFATYRNQLVESGQRRGHTLSINWPLWQDGGMQMVGENQEALRKTFGMHPMPASSGVFTFHYGLELGYSQTMVMEGDVVQMRKALLENQKTKEKTASAPSRMEQPVSKVNTESLTEQTQEYLCKQFAVVLGIAADKLDPQAPLEKYGIDSILAMSLTAQLEKTFDALPKTLFFEYQTIQELTEYFIKYHADRLSELFATGEKEQEPLVEVQRETPVRNISKRRLSRRRKTVASKNTNRQIHDDDPIVIVGLSGRYPEAANIEAYWRNLREGKDCITEVPKDRWDWHEYYSDDRTQTGHHFSKWGGFIEGVDEFDPRFFNISPREAASIDPQERLFLQHAWMAVEDAGYTRASLQISHDDDMAGQVGVYVGVMYSEYQLFGAEESMRGNRMGISGSYASVANRVSYFLNLHGPSMTIDTMCSSSLTAIHIACQDLKEGRTNLAIAGGVNVSIHPNKYLMLSAGQFISNDGHCQSFGEGGDGYIPGEGVGAVVLKRLSEAKRDGNHIYGIIKGSSLNHGGKTNGYSVPNPKAQASAISRALKDADTDPRHISYIEAHGTGTKLGDPIEIAALTRAFHQNNEDTGYCLIGSAKSNIGHCESAAGIAGLTKILLQIQHRKIVPSLHSKRLNPHIDFEKTPFIVNQTLTDWEKPQVNGKVLPRIAGISSFGAGGSNAHIVIEEYPVTQKVNTLNGTKVIIPLSARTAEQLKQKAQDLLEFIHLSEQESRPIDLADMAYTLQAGREAMEERLGFVVNSLDQLAEKLQAYLSGKESIEDFYQGRVKRNQDSVQMFATEADMQKTVANWVADKKLTKLLDLWIKGVELDWQKLYGATRPKTISLPTYPFARERYWVDISETPMVSGATSTAVLHPLLHANSSDFTQQSYSSTFRGDEFFSSDYQVNIGGLQKVFPAAASLEMARAAIERSLPAQTEPYILELRNAVWADPAVVSENWQVNIALFAQTNDTVDFEIYSIEQEGEVVHCQAQAIVTRQPSPFALNIAQLRGQMNSQMTSSSLYSAFNGMGLSYGASYQAISSIEQGNGQLLAHLNLPEAVEQNREAYQLHPAMVEGALQAGIALLVDMGQPLPQPLQTGSIDAVSLLNSCTEEMYAWVCYSADSQDKIDIDLCDAQGNVCVQMRGVSYYEEAVSATEQPTQKQSAPVQQPVQVPQSTPKLVKAKPKQLHITPPAEENTASHGLPVAQKFERVSLKKPTNVSLVTPEALKLDRVLTQKAVISLSSTSAAMAKTVPSTNGASYVTLFDNGNGIYAIKINAKDNILSKEVAAQLVHALNYVKQLESVKVLTLSGSSSTFLKGGREEFNVAIEENLYQTLASFPHPVIAIMQGDATGTGFLVGALSDFMVGSEESVYTYKAEGLLPTVSEERVLTERFGEAFAKDMLYQSATRIGKELKANGWSFPIVPSTEVEAYAERLAEDLASKSALSLSLLKQHLGRHILAEAEKLKAEEGLKAESKPAASHQITSDSKLLKVETGAEQVLTLRIAKSKKKDKLKDIVSGLSGVFGQVEKGKHYKAVILTSDDAEFISGSGDSEGVLELQDILNVSPVPVIAATAGATDAGWLISQSCDACIYQEAGTYSAANLLQDTKLARVATMILGERLSHHVCKEILLTGKSFTGADLQQAGGIVVSKDVQSEAQQQAQQWTQLPWEAVNSWKKERAAAISAAQKQLPEWVEVEEKTSGTLPKKATAIKLKSSVIKATIHPEGIVEVRMEDREAKNMFSPAFIEGMVEVFDHIAQAPEYKVVVFSGYDSYFASGGTKESLLAIQEGKAKFTDTKIFQLALNCKLPVIAAMQGHGIGAGWSMGMFADFTLFSEESHYVSPYMNYGFTPGAGATMIFPDKTGYDLARETLMTAVEYSGSELKGKGLSLPVLSRKQILSTAFDLAKEIAKNTRSSLIAFKNQLTKHLYDLLDETLSSELDMHEKTFVGQTDTLNQIESNFYSASGEVQPQVLPVEQTPVPTPQSTSYSADALPEIINSLKKLLAKELHMQVDEIDEDSQFVDLGLDSIIGVTFIRKISDKYNIPLQATIVYSYSTIAKLAGHVKEEAEKLGTLVSEPVAPAVVEAPAETPVSTSTNTAADADVLPDIISGLKKLLAKELHMQEDEIDEDSQFVDLGLDSIIGVTFIRRISDKYNIPLQATIVYSYSTIAKLSEHVKEEGERLGTIVSKPVTPAPAPVETPAVQVARKVITKLAGKKLESWRNGVALRTTSTAKRSNQSQTIAVVGMAGQFPEAKNVEEFWQNIAEGKNCISEIPQERWDVNKYYQKGDPVPGKTSSKWMGQLAEYDLFDPLFFTISPIEAESMDPQQRLFMQACWHAIESAGYNPHALSGSKCGVYVGCAYGDYQNLSREQQLSAQGFTGGSTSILAARISYFLNLQGPCVSMDTACSSSLVAIANACDSLVAGSIDSALAGGVYVMGGPDMHIKTSQSGMLSPDGRCYTFDQRANGFVPGEGVGVVMLKRLEDAERDNDNILGTIKGWGLNQDGKTNGITAPNTESQIFLEQQVYDQFQIDPNDIQLIEAHGTGTKLGDPIEVDGLRRSFKKYTEEKEYCALGSVKSNIGHCLTAAGVAGFIKVLQAMKHQQLPPTINFEKLNEHINLDGSPFYVNTQLKDWKVKETKQRLAAISSFGFSGTNAHLVLGEYIPQPSAMKKPVQVITQNDEHMIPLSAKSEEQLKQRASDLLKLIERERESIDLIELAYTLQVGREAMEDRLGFMVNSVDQLAKKLQAYIDGDEDIAGVYQGQVNRNKEGLRIISNDADMREAIIKNWISQKKLSKLLDLWVKGLNLDWSKLYGENKPKRMSLPVYPFAKERYWIEVSDEANMIANGKATSVLHPLLHVNTSDFSRQSYSATFNGEEFFLRDHQVFKQKVLPGVAYLEMIREAIGRSMPDPTESAVLELHNIAWIQPFMVNQRKQINAALYLDDSDPEEGELIHYEISSDHDGEEATHFQGQAIFSSRSEAEKLDIAQLRAQMKAGKLERSNIYAAFTQMELYYGPAHQGIEAIYRGEGQVLADLVLPAVVENEHEDYVLHPSLMDSALQASIGLFQGLDQVPSQPMLPFALESLSIISACTKKMVAWVRYSPDSDPDGRVTKLDIDLCDEAGTVCVQIKGFAFRVMESSSKPIHTTKNGSVNQNNDSTAEFDDAYYQKLIQSVMNKELSDEEAMELI